MVAERLLPNDDAREMLTMVRRFAQTELAPRAAAAEKAAEFPREQIRALGELGLVAMPYPEEHGGLNLGYEVYLQALEEIATGWMTVGIAVSVHVMTCFAIANEATPEQRRAFLPGMLGGDQLGAYCLSEPQAGSDVGAIKAKAERRGDTWVLNGTKAWVSHAGHADYYLVFARTDDHALGCFLVPADAGGLSFGKPEEKMGLTASPTAQVFLDGVEVDQFRVIGAPTDGMGIALSALDSGRLGIAACATGLGQAALDAAVEYTLEREQFGQPVASFQGMQFLLADMAAAVDTARAMYLQGARRRDAGLAFTREAAAAKLVATDAAMRVTSDAVQAFGGYGYTREFAVERYMREAKVTQIFEGTNQIQRMVIARQLLRGRTHISRG